MSVYTQIERNTRLTIMLVASIPLALAILLEAAFFAFVYITGDMPDVAGVLGVYDGVNSTISEGIMLLQEGLYQLNFSPISIPSNISYVGASLWASFGYLLWFMPILIGISIGWVLWMVYIFRHGEDMVLSIAEAEPLRREDNREIYDLVENLAKVAGIAPPQIYVVDDESLNAFAAGSNPRKSVVALTSGLIEKLDKREMEAVIAHEISHIVNRDNLLMVTIALGIGIFAFIGELLLRSCRHRSRGNGKGNAIVLLAILLGIVFMIFSYIIAPLVRLAISRRREFQADASAVKLTRYPEALVSALQKISKDARVEVLDARPAVGALCIADPLDEGGFAQFIGKLSGLGATHPPIKARINALVAMGARVPQGSVPSSF